MKTILIVIGFASFIASAAAFAEPIDPTLGCKSNRAVVAACYSIRARIFYANGTPGMRIWRVGTKRYLGVLPSENEIIPDNLKGKVNFENNVYATLEVCPFTQSRPGWMQFVCIESAKNIVVRKSE